MYTDGEDIKLLACESTIRAAPVGPNRVIEVAHTIPILREKARALGVCLAYVRQSKAYGAPCQVLNPIMHSRGHTLEVVWIQTSPFWRGVVDEYRRHSVPVRKNTLNYIKFRIVVSECDAQVT